MGGNAAVHRAEVLFQGEMPFPLLPACEHFAANEKFIRKTFALQAELGPVLDLTCDCEDGADVRVHDPAHPAFRQGVGILRGEAGAALACLTVPKPADANQAARAVDHLHPCAAQAGLPAAPSLRHNG